MNEFLNYIFTSKDQIITLLLEHIKLTALSVGIAIIIGMPFRNSYKLCEKAKQANLRNS